MWIRFLSVGDFLHVDTRYTSTESYVWQGSFCLCPYFVGASRDVDYSESVDIAFHQLPPQSVEPGPDVDPAFFGDDHAYAAIGSNEAPLLLCDWH
jgi:hypothetical protein